MFRMTIVVGAIVSGILSGEQAWSQQATPLALKVSISDVLRRRYFLATGEISEFELKLSKDIAAGIKDRYWHRFCWQLLPTDKDKATPDGEIRIELDRNRHIDNWNLVLKVSRTNVPNVQHTFEPIEVLDPGELVQNHGPSRDELPNRLIEVLGRHFFGDGNVDYIHAKLRGIPIGEGLPSTSRGQATTAGEATHGAVLLPWKEYNQFRRSRFRFESQLPNGFLQWFATASGGSWMIGNNEVIDVICLQLPMQAPARGSVYLVEFVEDGPGEFVGGVPVAR